ncbi:MAG: hypothetical protein ABL897_12645 [Hyphomicrobium sp.]
MLRSVDEKDAHSVDAKRQPSLLSVMSFLRWHKGLIGQFAAAAVLLHALLGAVCPHAKAHRANTGYFDAVLGWVTLCLPSALSDDSAKAPASQTGQSTSHDHCATTCVAAVQAFAVAAAAYLLALLVPLRDSASRILALRSREPSPYRAWSRLTVRGPPLLT